MIHFRAAAPIAAILAAAVAYGCAFNERIADQAVDYNATVAEAHNATLLLNILRARDRQPMHFTALTKVLGRLTRESTAGLAIEIPFGGDAAAEFPLTPSLELSQTSSPSFDVVVLDSQEFITGILTPVDPSIFAFYWDQRWPPEVLLFLLIHKIEITETNSADATPAGDNSAHCPPVSAEKLVNSPRSDELGEGFRKFRRWVNGFIDCGYTVGIRESGHPIGPPYPVTDAAGIKGAFPLKAVLSAEKEGLQLVGAPKDNPDAYQLCKSERRVVLCMEECPEWDAADDCRRAMQAGQSGAAETYLPSQQRPGAAALLGAGGKELGTLHFRSVQGVIYYLGEILRYQRKHGPIYIRKTGRDDATTKDEGEGPGVTDECGGADDERPKRTVLFELTTDRDEADRPLMGVVYDGVRYYVRKERGEDDKSGATIRRRTKTVLALVNQLLGLHKKREELPTTTAVEIVGGTP